MEGIFLLLGSNLGDRDKWLEQSRFLIEKRIGPILKASGIYESASWGVKNQDHYLNQVLSISTSLEPELLLIELQKIEKVLGRERSEKWGSRTIDLDILYYHDQVVHTPSLQIPHPQIPFRSFTLHPLAELIPSVKHPVLPYTHLQLLERCQDTGWVRTYPAGKELQND